jgi:hypothetical protein
MNKIKMLVSEMNEEYDLVLSILPFSRSRMRCVQLMRRRDDPGPKSADRSECPQTGQVPPDHAQANVTGIVLTNVKSEVTPDYGVYRYEYR